MLVNGVQIYLLDRRPIVVTRSEGSNAQLYWPFQLDETCQSVLVSPVAFGATSVPGPKDLKSPWQQSLHVSWAAELTRKHKWSAGGRAERIPDTILRLRATVRS